MTGVPLRILLHIQDRFTGWAGGLNYLRAVIALLDMLPEEQRPDITIFDDLREQWSTGPRGEWIRPAVTCVLGMDGTILHARDGAIRTALDLLDPMQRRRTLARQADAIYPIMPGDAYPVNPRHWLWIPDFQHRHLPEFFTPEEWNRRETRFQNLLARPCPLILSSQAAMADLETFYPGHAAIPFVWPFRSLAYPQGADRLREVRDRYGLPARYLFIPNQFWGHKDHATAFHALAMLRDRGCGISLICTGGKEDHRDPGHYDRLFTMAGELGLTSIRHLGSIPHADVLACLQMATCVVQPSRFEGWSTLVEDALALGAPIAASRLPVHVEQIGEGGLFFTPGDAGALAELLIKALPCLPDSPPEDRVQAAAIAYEQLRKAAAAALIAHFQACRLPVEDGRG